MTEVETGRKLRYSIESTELVIRNLHPFYLYNCTVTAVTVDEGPYSAVIGARTEEAGKHINIPSLHSELFFMSPDAML